MTALGTVVVTGSTGFIGSALVRRAIRDGTRVIALTRAESPKPSRPGNGVEVVPLTSFEPDAIAAALGSCRCDAVFHLAADGVAAGAKDPRLLLEGNATLTANVLIAAKAWQPRRFVFAGSCAEYAPASEGTLIAEDHAIRPTSLYGAAKAAAHVYARALARELGIDFVGLRLFGTYGPGEAPARLIPHLISRLSSGEEPELTSGNQVRDLSFVDDVVEALILAASAPGIEPRHAYNVCSGVGRRIGDVAHRVAELMGRADASLGIGRRPDRADEPLWLVGNPARFREATGWTPRVSLDDGIERMLEAKE